MKVLRIICIFILAASLMLVSVGTVFAKGGPPADVPGKGAKFQGEKEGFSGNVTDVVAGNVTIETLDKGTVTVALTDDARYKIPSVMNKWGTLDQFKSYLVNGNLSALEGRRVVTLAGNSTGIWSALQFMALPVPGISPMHAHRAGNVTQFNEPSSGNSWIGNITILDVQNVTHIFKVGNDTVYRPMGIGAGNITAGKFVTVVTTGNQKSVDLPSAKAIVLHDSNMPED